MANQGDTDALRLAAPDWSLDGDQRLLDLLQAVHKKITSKCSETSGKLSEMVASLDTASVSLQNVNNRFMALSNTQFVESRVYDDDTDVATAPAPVKKPPENPRSPEEALLRSIETIEAMHEPVTILDDSDSGSEDDMSEKESVILQPKDLYGERPLPYIIGSLNWKSKWHAGLLLEDSDTESTTSRRTDRQTDQYSDSESEGEQHTDVQPETSYSLPATSPQMRADSEESLYRPQMTTVYKPALPPTAPLFSDEPPPIDNHLTFYSSDEDIYFEEPEKPPLPAQKPNLFQEEENSDDSELYFGKPVDPPEVQEQATEDKHSLKKPVGAVSLFGSSKGTDSIGAAILKRNQRKSSSDESDEIINSRPQKRIAPNPDRAKQESENVVSTRNETVEEEKPKESSIFDELFAKTEKKNKVEAKKVDIFSDIFDDIDDIFTKDVKKETKSIFDDEMFSAVRSDKQTDVFNDDVFVEPPPLPEEKTNKEKVSQKTKSIFYDDDDKDIFGGDHIKKPVLKEKPIATQNNKSEKIQKTKSIFDSDSDDGDIFSKIKPTSVTKSAKPSISPDNKDSFSNETIDNNTVKDILTTEQKTGSTDITEALNIVPNTNILDNVTASVNIENNHKDVIATNNAKTPQEVNKKAINKDLFEDKSEDDWETDLPSNDEDNKGFEVKANEKPKILGKPKLPEKTSIQVDNTKPVGVKNQNISDYEQNNEQKTSKIEKSKPTEKESKQKSTILDDVFKDESSIFKVKKSTEDDQSIESLHKKDGIVKEKSVNDNISSKQEITIEQNSDQISVSVAKNDIFDDLFFDQPPPLPKDKVISTDIFLDIPPPIETIVKETKNTNINALFGDDSDDESLYFKTETPMDDVPPKFDALENIFHDEPPDIDIDFVTESPKSKTNDKSIDNSIKEDKKEFSNQDKAVDETDQSDISKVAKNDKSDVVDAKPIGKLKPIGLNINVNTLLPGASPKKTVKLDSNDTSPVKAVVKDTKATDGFINNPVNIITSKTENAVEPKEVKMVKSVSFDSDPDSLVLNNKISKERAKIQVKRRPSSRKARQDAVRKSGIDFIDAKNIDEHPDKQKPQGNNDFYEENFAQSVVETENEDVKTKKLDIDDNIEKSDINTQILPINSEDVYIFNEPKAVVTIDILGTDSKKQQENNEKDNQAIEKPEKIKNPLSEQIKDSVQTKKTLSIFDDEDDIFGGKSKLADSKKTEFYKENDSTEDFRKPAKSGRRLVITDDDDDIFSASNTVFKENKVKTNSNLNTTTKITEDNNDTFKSMTKSVKNNTISFLDDNDDGDLFNFTKKSTKSDVVQTLGKAYEDDNLFKPKTTETVEKTGNTKQGSIDKKSKQKSLFDDSSDEELFGGKKTKSKKEKMKPNDDDLFSKKSSTKKDVTSTKGKLFDDVDDGDLFGTKKTEKEQKSHPKEKPAQRQIQEKTSNPQKVVFDDPLSMFGDDD